MALQCFSIDADVDNVMKCRSSDGEILSNNVSVDEFEIVTGDGRSVVFS